MNQINKIVEKQRLFFDKEHTKELSFRLEQLKRLRKEIIDNQGEIMKALKKDLNKSSFEAYETEIGLVLEELKFIIKNLPNWVKRDRVKTPIAHFISTSYTYSEPYGVSLVMSPWNYPFQLTMVPLIGSMAAGNCTILKPSEYSFYTSEVIEKIIGKNFDASYITVIRGGREANKSLLDEKFDYIFFTGSVPVGRIVMEAASKHLTPVTLELGGKSPCIVDETANIDLAAKRITWGKFLNAGQTCVAPDYLLVHKSVKDKLVARIKYYIKEFYGSDPCNNMEYPKIINDKHFHRLLRLLEGEKIVFGGNYKEKTNQISPTIVENVSWESALMENEIFGPILPVLEFNEINEVISVVNQRPKPLALYYFSNRRDRQKKIIKSISFGGGCINDTIVHLASSYLPFGGVGNSGMGGYHGKASFDTFSHKKSILKKSNLIDIPLRYPPYKNKLELLKKIMK